MMYQRSGAQVIDGPGPLVRASISPTYFSSMVVDRLEMDTAIDAYFDWIEGRGRTATRRRRQGVPEKLDRVSLLADGGQTISGENGAEISVRTEDGQFVLRFVHRDDDHADVVWYSLVRLTEVESENAMPALMIEHGSGRSLPPFKELPPIAGAPGVLRQITGVGGVKLRGRDLAHHKVLHIKKGEAEGFVKYVLFDQNRTLPVLLVSPTTDTGRYMVAPDQLNGLLYAQVTIAQIDGDATWEFLETFEAKGCSRDLGVCFDGAARLYHAGLDPEQNPREHYLWLPHRLKDFGTNATLRLAGEVSERATWRALPQRFFSILEEVDRKRTRCRANAVLEQRVSDISNLRDKVVALEELNENLRVQLNEALEENERSRAETERAEADVEQQQRAIEQAEQDRDDAASRLYAASARIMALEQRGAGLTKEQIEALHCLASGDVKSLRCALVLLELIYGNRVAILPSAWKTADEASVFEQPQKAWEHIKCLGSDYWLTIQKSGDAAARLCFPKGTYAAQESEPVQNRKGAQRKRTFDYNGVPTIMWQHLKIGNKDSIHKTWRMHFIFDADTKKIVVGHCGKHLDFK